MPKKKTLKTDPINKGQTYKKTSITINKKLVKSANIFFALPCYGNRVTSQFFLSFLKLNQFLSQEKIDHDVGVLSNQSLITRARNNLTAVFLANKEFTHMMFIDVDLDFNPEDILRMIAMDKDIIAGAYPRKDINWTAINNASQINDPNLSTTGTRFGSNLKITVHEGRGQVRTHLGTFEALDATTGFMLIKRGAIEAIIKANPQLKCEDEVSDPDSAPFYYDIFSTMIDPKTKRYLSEDFAFCRRFQDIGGEIWIDPTIKLGHVGDYVYKGNFALNKGLIQ